jgi:Tfp pilus assembly protein PilX
MRTQTNAMKMSARNFVPARQRGASSLFLTVILVMVVMLLTVTASVLSTTQFRLAGNLQFENIAFNLAETAVARAENWLSTGTHAKDGGFATRATTTPALYPIGSLTADPLTMAWNDSNSCVPSTDVNTPCLVGDADSPQRYLVEKYGADNQPLGTGLDSGGRPLTGCQKVDVFLVTARGTSARGTTKSIQTTYSVPSC